MQNLYEKNYHISKGELLALDYGLKKLTVRSDNSTVIHLETMNAEWKPLCEKVVETFLFNMKLVLMAGKFIPAYYPG